MVLAIWQINLLGFQDVPTNLISRFTALISPATSPSVAAFSMFFFLSASRLGLWAFDLTTQELTQIRVPATKRSSFAGTEMSFVSVFELGQWVLAFIFARPDQFQWLSLGSLVAVRLASFMYAFWVRQQRGHLLHWDRLSKSCDCTKRGG